MPCSTQSGISHFLVITVSTFTYIASVRAPIQVI